MVEPYMNGVVNFLKGKKTYLQATGMAAVVFAFAMGWIDMTTLVVLDGLLLAGGLASLRAAVSRGQ